MPFRPRFWSQELATTPSLQLKLMGLSLGAQRLRSSAVSVEGTAMDRPGGHRNGQRIDVLFATSDPRRSLRSSRYCSQPSESWVPMGFRYSGFAVNLLRARPEACSSCLPLVLWNGLLLGSQPPFRPHIGPMVRVAERRQELAASQAWVC